LEIFEKIKKNNYVLWLGDNINKKLNIPTKNELALKIYGELSEDIKEIVQNKESLIEVSQAFLDSLSGNMMNLITLLEEELELKERYNPYSYLSNIVTIDTVITHDHSKVLESIWEDGVVHNIFCEKKVEKDNVNLFKILGDYEHIEKIILTSQKMRRVKQLKLYNPFWEKLGKEIENKNLILMGVNLDEDTKDLLTLVFSKINMLNVDKYFVNSNSISMEDESWLIANNFEFIYEDDLDFIKKMALHFNNEYIDIFEENIKIDIDITEEIDNEKITEENLLESIEISEEIEKAKTEEISEKVEEIKVEEILEEISEKIEKAKTEEKILPDEKQLKIFHQEESLVVEKKKEILDINEDPIEEKEIIIEENLQDKEKKYIVENLNILLELDGRTLKGKIIETEVKDRKKRLTEFREERYPSYKFDDFSEIDHYKALDIKIPFEYNGFPQMKLEKKIFSGKINIRCNDQTIYNVAVRSYMSGKYQVVDFKNYDFYLKLLLENDNVVKFSYKISENTVNIKGRNIYIFFKNLFDGFELNFKNKKISGSFKIISNDDVEKLDIILGIIDKYLSIKKQIKINDITLKELLKNTRSLDVLFSYYNNTPKITNGNVTIRTNFVGELGSVEKLLLSYPVSINFLGFVRSFIESTEIEINRSNINYSKDQLEIQAFNVVQNIRYKEMID